MRECFGCSHYDDDLDECYMTMCKYLDRVSKCPCRTCIIKVVCSDTCEEYIKVASGGIAFV